MKTRILSILLTMAMLLSMMPMVAFAENEEMVSVEGINAALLDVGETAKELELSYQDNSLLLSGEVDDYSNISAAFSNSEGDSDTQNSYIYMESLQDAATYLQDGFANRTFE